MKIKFQYIMELSHYLNSLILLFIEPRLKDFYQMLAHHIITILLIVLSYHINIIRYGIVIMVIHDCSDPFLELAKLFFYLNKQKAADNAFMVFGIVFFISRMIIYPFAIMAPAGYFFCIYNKSSPIMVTCGILMVMLLLINIVWMCFIAKMAIGFMKKGKLEGDIREKNIK
ncbi:LAG1 longevity assurance protein 4 [Spraguea lophii 42_110]|uniref:LAG1 longevity assurance protein 4 n=1 Tax=Spraguea lophii (strain 42_110) TaxID=1358809 RepID=S7W511_SPRLO|nr:LAG1 longevity assurance protein 4 [Spraguea lophii 42_110]